MKQIRITRRGAVLGSVLLMSIAAAVAVSKDRPGSVVAVADRAKARTPAAPAALAQGDTFASSGDGQLARVNARQMEGDMTPLFEATRKTAPERHARAAEAPGEPVAPPLPFRYLGQMTDEGRVTLFLSVNERNIAVRAGETIDDQYRIDSIDNGVAVFTYLPLKHRQTLPVGERS